MICPVETRGKNGKGALRRSLFFFFLIVPACFVPHDLGVRPFRLASFDLPLPSGLRVVFQRDTTQPSVIVTTVVEAGATDDPPGKEGLAHLVEHLWFRARGGAGARIEALGGVYNAETSWDEAEFWTIAPKDALAALLKLESERLEDPLAGVDEEQFGLERAVLVNEVRQRVELSPSLTGADELVSRVYPEGHPYHRRAGGTVEGLRSLTLEDARAFASAHYRPSRTTIIVAGDVDLAQAPHVVARSFTRPQLVAPGFVGSNVELTKPASRISTTRRRAPPPADHSVHHVSGAVALRTVVLAWSLPGAYRADQPLIEGSVAAMNGALDSFFRGRDVEHVACSVRLGLESSLATCSLEVVEGADGDAIAMQAIDRLYQLWDRRDLDAQEQLYRYVRSGYLTAMMRDSASLWRTISFARWVHFTGRADRFPRVLEDVKRIDLQNARSFAWTWLNRSRVVVTVVDPLEDSAPLRTPGGALGEALPAVSDGGGMVTTTSSAAAEVARIALAPDLTRVRRFTLPNGLDVVLMRHGSAPFLEAGLLTGGGWADAEPRGIPALVAEEWRPADAAILGEWFEEEWSDAELIGIAGPSGAPGALLRELGTRIRSATASDRAEDRRDRVAALVRRERSVLRNPESRAEQALWGDLLGDHPLGFGTIDAPLLARIDHRDVSGWLHATRAPRNATLLVVGDLEFDNVEALVRHEFTRWRRDDQGERRAPMPPPRLRLPSRRVLIADRPGALETSIEVGCRLDPRTAAPGSASRDLLEEALRADLFARLRLSGGDAYQVGAATRFWRGGTALFFANATVESTRAPEVLIMILARLRDLSAGHLPAESLEAARWTLARRTWTRDQSAAEMLLTLASTIRDGEHLESLGEYGRDLAALSQEDLAELLSPCIGHEVAAITGPAELLEAPLRERGFETMRLAGPSGAPAEVPHDPAAQPASAPRPARIRVTDPLHIRRDDD